MLSRLWIAFLISLSGILTIAWLVALMHEKDIRPVRDMVGFFKKQSKAGRVVFGIMFLAFWLIASVKPDGGGNGGDPGGGDGGGTNNVQMVIGPGGGLGNVANVEVLPITSTNAQLGESVQLENGNIGTGNNITMATLITSTNTTRTITGDDFRRGFVMSRVGTDEVFDFSAPSNAVVCADWRAFGAATDWIYANVKWKMESVKWGMGNGEWGTGGVLRHAAQGYDFAVVVEGHRYLPQLRLEGHRARRARHPLLYYL